MRGTGSRAGSSRRTGRAPTHDPSDRHPCRFLERRLRSRRVQGRLKLADLVPAAGDDLLRLPVLGQVAAGLPIGIWALIVLSKPEIKSAFR